MKALADGKATKLIVPSDIAKFVSMTEIAGEGLKNGMTAETVSDTQKQIDEVFDPDTEPAFVDEYDKKQKD